jgi:predicted short-subunit dehydrogenase-like oxidoreductase (DUF2520 family)
MSVAAALVGAGHDIAGFVSSDEDASDAASGVDVLIISVPDRRIADVARKVRPVETTAVLHLSGSQGLEVLAPHLRRGSMHPLVPMPNPEVGAARLAAGVTFAVAGDPVAGELAASMGGRIVSVRDEDRAAYHAAACIASNHVVALMAQVERVASEIGLDLDVFLGLARAALADVEALGPSAALTGPAARGDLATLARHRAALAPDERAGYDAGAELARRLAEDRAARQSDPGDLVAADLVPGDLVAADLVTGGLVAADRVAADRVAADRVAGDRVAADRVAADRVAVAAEVA